LPFHVNSYEKIAVVAEIYGKLMILLYQDLTEFYPI